MGITFIVLLSENIFDFYYKQRPNSSVIYICICLLFRVPRVPIFNCTFQSFSVLFGNLVTLLPKVFSGSVYIGIPYCQSCQLKEYSDTIIGFSFVQEVDDLCFRQIDNISHKKIYAKFMKKKLRKTAISNKEKQKHAVTKSTRKFLWCGMLSNIVLGLSATAYTLCQSGTL